MITFSSPCNPSGQHIVKELEELAKVIENQSIYVVSDEIYELINGIKHFSIGRISIRGGLVNGVSKGFAMTGWRVVT